MTPRKSTFKPGNAATDVERRFARLLQVMKGRYLDAGYELDDVHLAEILGVHDGVLRKGKSTSVSPSLARAVGKIWDVDLNWLLLGKGREPDRHGEPRGLERLSGESRIARGRWDEHKVRRLLAERKMTQKELADLLRTDPQRAGNLVRGTLRDPELRKRLSRMLKVSPDSFFLVSEHPPQADKARSDASRQTEDGEPLYTVSEVSAALEDLLSAGLEEALEKTPAASGDGSGAVKQGAGLEVPPPPAGLSEIELRRYEQNRRVLERWGASEGSFEVPPEVAGRYCREVVGFYEGGRIEDVGGILREFIQDSAAESDTRPAGDPEGVRLESGVLVVGDTELRVEDPELLARLPEYLASKAGRRRLLSWLKKNAGR